jgi:30S ribosomal protein 3
MQLHRTHTCCTLVPRSPAPPLLLLQGQKSPLTEYHFWPYTDAWEELKAALEARPWITERDRFVLLNRLTEVINYWQEQETKHTVDEAKATFADCTFIGA